MATSLVAGLVEQLDRLIAACTSAGEIEAKGRDLAEQDPVDAGAVFTLLTPLRWDELWALLDQLARQGPTLDGMTYLELVHEAADQHPNLDMKLQAATLAVLLAHGGRTLDASEVPKAEKFAICLTPRRRHRFGCGSSTLPGVLRPCVMPRPPVRPHRPLWPPETSGTRGLTMCSCGASRR